MRRVPAIVACLVATLLLAAPALADTRSRDLRVATTTKIDTLNPLVGTLESEYRVWALNFDLLIAFDSGDDEARQAALAGRGVERLERRPDLDVSPAARPGLVGRPRR